MLTPEQIKQYRQKYKINPIDAPTPAKQGSISKAFQSGIEKTKQGYQEAKQAKSPYELLSKSVKMGAGAVETAFSPLAPLAKPIEKGVEFVSEKVSDIPAVQKFAQTKTGEAVERGAEDIANLATITGAVAGGMKAPKVAGAITETAGKVKPAVSGVGKTLKQAGESTYGVTVPPSEGVARAMQIYKESTPNLVTRIKNTVTGETKGKPITEANTAARYGLLGTEQEIGVQAGRFMGKIWKEQVQPTLKGSKVKMDIRKLQSAIKSKIIKENPELGRQKALLSDLEDFASDYKNVSGVGLEKAQNYKSGWTKFQSEQAWKGKPISSTAKEIRMMAADFTRDFINKNIPEKTRQAYIDYGNLKSIREAGIKSGVGDLAKKSISRGAWQFVMDKAVTPVATTLGKILYRTGEGLEFIGEQGAKTVGDIVGETPK